MNLGAFFATMLALGQGDPVSQSAQLHTQRPAVAQIVPISTPTQVAALPSETEPATTPPATPPAQPKVKTAKPGVKKGPPGSKPGTTTAQRKAPPPRKAQAVAKQNGTGKTPVVAACPAGSSKSPTTGRCSARAKAATPPA